MDLNVVCLVLLALSSVEVLGFEGQDGYLREKVVEEDEIGHEKLLSVLQPVVAGLSTCEAKASAVGRWMLTGTSEKPLEKIKMGFIECRPKNALQLAEARQGGCYEFNICFISCMRALGVSARMVTVGWWYSNKTHQGNGGHFFSEYWDTEKEQWVVFDAPDRHLTPEFFTRRIEEGRWNTLAYYVLDSNPVEVDPVGRGDWSGCLNRSHHFTSVYEMRATVGGGFQGDDEACAQILVWNSGSWRAVLNGDIIPSSQKEDAEVSFQVAKGAASNRPVLITVANDGQFKCAFAKPEDGLAEISLAELKEGEWLQWGTFVRRNEH
ncbi:MAG: transglutaminase-like domain-containing protein [Verrucomicrobiota bacterium JB023]|nr:transglutaminase-like domain-containing protein [Verrucomicrobiota bacterium JB023]